MLERGMWFKGKQTGPVLPCFSPVPQRPYKGDMVSHSKTTAKKKTFRRVSKRRHTGTHRKARKTREEKVKEHSRASQGSMRWRCKLTEMDGAARRDSYEYNPN